MPRTILGFRFSSATIRIFASLIVATTFLIAHGESQASGPQFVVLSAADTPDSDPTDGVCRNDQDGCTLRAAIMQANQDPDENNIIVNSFNILSDTIVLDSTLPILTERANIRGFNTIEIKGTNVTGSSSERSGFRVDGASVSISGFAINDFDGAAIEIKNSSGIGSLGDIEDNLIGTDLTGTVVIGNGEGIVIEDSQGYHVRNNLVTGPVGTGLLFIGCHIQLNGAYSFTGDAAHQVYGNFIGTNADGTVAFNNGDLSRGICVFFSPNNKIGLIGEGLGNVVSGHNGSGIELVESNGTTIQNNVIGTDITGTQDFGNFKGVWIIEGSNNSITDNTIAFSEAEGVRIDEGTGNSIRSNSIYSNGGLGIDLGGDGVTQNDTDDVDASPNMLQNFPVITSVNGITGKVEGTLNSTAVTDFTIEVFSSADCDPSGYGEGQTLIGTADVHLGIFKVAGFTVDTVLTNGHRFVTATTTDENGNTSEFSPCVVPDQIIDDFTDAPDADLGDGVCDTDLVTDGLQCTLRAAIMQANENPGAAFITLLVGTYMLTIDGAGEDDAATGDLDVTSEITILGSGKDDTVINGNKGNVDDNIFHIKRLTANDDDVAALTLKSVTVTNGDRVGLLNEGGVLVIERSVVRNNDEIGIENHRTTATASLTVQDTTISDNGSSGIYSHSTTGIAQATIVGSTISDNGAYGVYLSNSNSTARATVIPS